MEVPSLRPELGYELLKLVMLRESYIQRLGTTLTKHNQSVDMGTIGIFDVLRELTIQIIEMISEWEKAQVAFPKIEPFTWNGANYLAKIASDLDQFSSITSIRIWLGFSVAGNPFIIPPEVLIDENISVPDDAFLVFGQIPATQKAKVKASGPKHTKSPYTTPIINDPEVFTHLSVKNKLDRKFKNKVQVSEDLVENDELNTGNTGFANNTGYNPFLCYLSMEMLKRIRICNNKLISVVGRGQKRVTGTGAGAMATSDSTTDFKLSIPLLDVSTYDDSDTISKEVQQPLLSTLVDHSKDVYQSIDRSTNTHRYQITSSMLTGQPVMHWSPHEVALQKQVQRKGGELYTITITSTSGRMKVPYRKTRYQRMSDEMSSIKQEIEYNSMLIEDILLYRQQRALKEEESLYLEQLLSNRTVVKKHLQWRYNLISTIFTSFLQVAQNQDLFYKDAQYERYTLAIGQTRLEDEIQSLSLEESSIKRIQLYIRRVFGKVLRQLERRRQLKATLQIQSAWRVYKVNQLIGDFIHRQRLAGILCKLFRMKQAAHIRSQLYQDKALRCAILLIQRCFRGYLGRKKLLLKKTFVYSLKEAASLVSSTNLKPGDIEGLADAIEDYVNDLIVSDSGQADEPSNTNSSDPINSAAPGSATAAGSTPAPAAAMAGLCTVLPLEALTIIRGILFILNNNNSEYVIVNSNDGYTEKKYIYAKTASWEAVKLVLRRKGRFLRRLRSFIKHSLPPNASYIYLSRDAYSHLQAIATDISMEADAPGGYRGQQCIQQLYRYLINIYQAYNLQDIFPEYFTRSLPSWYRMLISIKEAYDHSECNRKVENRIQYRLEECKRYQAREGKKYKHISYAIHKNKLDLDNCRTLYNRSKTKLKNYMINLLQTEQQQIYTLEAIVRAKTLAVEVAEGDYKEYMKIALIPDEAYLKELLYNIDNKQLSLVTAQSDLIYKKELFEKYQSYRDFDHLCKYKHIYEYCNELGKVKADLYILLEAYKALIEEIGGTQYLPDMKGRVLARHTAIKSQSIELMAKRRYLEDCIAKELQAQYERLYKMVLSSSVMSNYIPHKSSRSLAGAAAAGASSSYNAHVIESNWDHLTTIERDYEENENKVCCKRDYEKEFRKKRKMESFTVSTPFQWTPCILFIDIKLPRAFIQYLHHALLPYNFVPYSSRNIVNNTTLQDELQGMIDKKCNIIISINRSLHPLYYIPIDNYIASIKTVLIPVPRCVYISAEFCFTAGSWFEASAFDQHAFTNMEAASSPTKEAANMTKGYSIHDTSQKINLTSAAKQKAARAGTNALTSNTQPHYDRYLYDILVGKMRKIGRYFRFILINNQHIQGEGQVGSNKGHAGKGQNELYKQLEATFCRAFLHDFHHFLHHIKELSRLVKQFKGKLDLLDDSQWGDVVIAVNLAIILDIYDMPLINPSQKEIARCLIAFRKYLASISFQQLCELLENVTVSLAHYKIHSSPQPSTGQGKEKNRTTHESIDIYKDPLFISKKLECNKQYDHIWKRYLDKLDYYVSPARVMLVKWIQAATEYLRLSLTHEHKFIPYDHIFSPLTSEIELCLKHEEEDEGATVEDIPYSNTSRTAMGNYGVVFLGELLHVFLSPLQVYLNSNPIWKLFYDLEHKESITAQSLGVKLFGTKRKASAAESDNVSATLPATACDRVQSVAYVYHHGEEIFLELHIFTSYACDADTIPVSADKPSQILNTFNFHDHINLRIFGKLVINDLIILIQPNYTEIFEGKNMNSQATYGLYREVDFYHLLSNWIVLDHLNSQVSMSIIRARYLILTKLTVINNYNVRVEIYEEKFGEILILIFGLPSEKLMHHSLTSLDSKDLGTEAGYSVANNKDTSVYNIRITRIQIFKLLSHCDPTEKDKLEAFDTIAMAYIFSDRLVISPSVLWRSFLGHQCLLPVTMYDAMEISLRYKRGPGRLVGRYLLDLSRHWFGSSATSSTANGEKEKVVAIPILLTLFEINTPQNSHELRVVLYHMYDCVTMEFRLSAMERLLLFNDQTPVLDQLINKLKLVYTDLNEPRDRVVLAIPQLNRGNKISQQQKQQQQQQQQESGYSRNSMYQLNIQPYEVEGDEEYEISSQVSDDPEEESKPTHAEEEEDSFGIPSDDESDDDGHTHHQSHSTAKYKVKKDSGWGWSLSFDRSLLSELRGNIVISVTLCLPRKGFNIYIYDPRTFYQVYRFISFHDSMAVLGKNLNMIEEEISNLDESNVLDLLDEILSSIEIQDNDMEGLMIVLLKDKEIPEDDEEDHPDPKHQRSKLKVSKDAASDDSSKEEKEGSTVTALHDLAALQKEGDTEEMVVLARIKELSKDLPVHPMSRKRALMSSFRLSLEILRAKDLSKVSTFGARNAVAIVKHNLREIGRTHVVKGTTQPDWSSQPNKNMKYSNRFDFHVNQDQLYTNCNIEIEVYDTDMRGVLTEYLGHIRLAGNSLKELLSGNDTSQPNAVAVARFYDLQKSKKRNDVENKHVKGSMEVSASYKELGSTAASAKEINKSTRRGSYMQLDSIKAGNKVVSTDGDPQQQLTLDKVFNISDLEEQLVDKLKTFYIYLVDVFLSIGDDAVPSTILNAKDTTLDLIVSVNHIETSKFSLPCRNKMVTQFTTKDCVEVQLPSDYPIPLCSISIDIYVNKPKSLHKKVTSISLTGLVLKNFIQKALDYHNHGQDQGQSKGSTKSKSSAVALLSYDLHSLNNHSYNGYLTLCGAVKVMPPKTFDVTIRSCRNLPKADLFGKSDPFVKVYLNAHQVGQTSVQRNTLNPVWNPSEHFMLHVPFHSSINNCTVVLEVFDYDDLSDEDLLGLRTLAGQELQMLLNPATSQPEWSAYHGELNIPNRTVYLPLYEDKHYKRFATDANKAINQRSLGDIEISLAAVADDKNHITAVADTSSLQQEYQKRSYPIENSLLYSPRKKYTLYILSAKGLANADTFGKSDPFVRIQFNGMAMAQTRTIYDVLSPVYNDSYQIYLPYHLQLSYCQLQLDVFDEDNYIGGDFLGTVSLAGEELVDLASYSNQVFSAHVVNSIQQHSEKGGLAGIQGQSYPLQKSHLYSKKANKLVKGSIQILLKEEEEDLELYPHVYYYNDQHERFSVSAALTKEIVEEDPFHTTSLIALKLHFGECTVMDLDEYSSTSVISANSKPSNVVEEVYCALIFNGECLYRIPGNYHVHRHAISWASPADPTGCTKKLNIPMNLHLDHCYLQLHVHNSEHKIMGMAYITGHRLQDALIQASRSSKSDETSLDIMLQHLPFLPTGDSRFDRTSQRIVMRVSILPVYKLGTPTVTTSSSTATAPSTTNASSFAKRASNSAYQLIRTNFDENEISWRYMFDQGAHHASMCLIGNHNLATLDSKPVPAKAIDAITPLRPISAQRPMSAQQANVLVTKLVNTRGARGQQEGSKGSNVNLTNEIMGSSSSALAPLFAPTEDAKPDVSSPTAAIGTAALVPDSIFNRVRVFEVEPAAVNFTVTIKSRLEEAFRVCWRGKVVPKQITFANSAMKKSVFASRSSRLIRTHSLCNLNIEADVHYLTEVTENEVVVQDDLPICVREVLTDSPGAIERSFRIEIYTNTSILLGTCDIVDNYQEFLCILGPQGLHLVYNKDPRDWDYSRIFAYVVNQRASLNLLSTQSPVHNVATEGPGQKHGRREGIMQAAEGGKDEAHSSVISLIKDSLEDVYAHIKIMENRDCNSMDDETSMKSNLQESSLVVSELEALSHRLSVSNRKKVTRSYYLRVLSKSHRLTGRAFCAMVLFFHAQYRHPWNVDALAHDKSKEKPMLKSRNDSMRRGSSSRMRTSRSNSMVETINSINSAFYSNPFDCLSAEVVEEIKMLSEQPDAYFQHKTVQEALEGINVIFRCQDVYSKKMYNVFVPGRVLYHPMSKIFKYDNLASKFRREKFGSSLLSFLMLRYMPSSLEDLLHGPATAPEVGAGMGADAPASPVADHASSLLQKAATSILDAAFGVHFVLPAQEEREAYKEMQTAHLTSNLAEEEEKEDEEEEEEIHYTHEQEQEEEEQEEEEEEEEQEEEGEGDAAIENEEREDQHQHRHGNQQEEEEEEQEHLHGNQQEEEEQEEHRHGNQQEEEEEEEESEEDDEPA